MRSVRGYGLIASLVFALGCGVGFTASVKAKPAEIGKSIKGYASWKAANKELYLVNREIWVLCRPPTKEEQARLRNSGHGGYVRVYVNKTGEKAMFSRAAFPVGSIIVKERHETESTPMQSCTVMRKREAGYNPACGDWEFAIIDGKGATEKAGRLDNCVKCHAEQKLLDFTFRSYVDKVAK